MVGPRHRGRVRRHVVVANEKYNLFHGVALMRWLLGLPVVLMSLAPLAASAQPTELASVERRPPPILVVDQETDHPVRLGVQRVDIAVRIVGRIAETRMTLTFANSDGRVRAGDLYLPLPRGATISGYALDIGGRMVDGVVVGKDEARRIFEIEVRKGVDPGLAEWTRGNVFHTRVFPIPANGTRTVMVRWVAPIALDASGGRYDLPLDFPAKLAAAHLRIEVAQTTVGDGARPQLLGGKGPLTLAFDPRLVAEASLTDSALVQEVQVRLPDIARHPAQTERDADGATWVAIQDDTEVPRLEPLAIQRLRIYWDASLSRKKADHTKELRLLARFLAERAPREVELVVFRNVAAPTQTFALPADSERLLAALRDATPDGGTSLAALAPPPGAAVVDAILVFSDGFDTIGDLALPMLGAPTWTLGTSPETAHDALARLAAQNGGSYVDLAHTSDDVALATLGRPVFSLLSVAVTDGEVADLVPSVAEPTRRPLLIAGRLVSASATIEARYGIQGRKPMVIKTFEVSAKSASSGDLLARAWAQKKLEGLMADPDTNARAILDLGRRHGIVTPGTSLLVLESLDQYLTHRVRPPASWPELRKAWDARIETMSADAKRTEASHLDEVAEAWDEEVAWYTKDFVVPPGFRYRSEKSKKGDAAGESFGSAGASRDSAPPRPTLARVEVADMKVVADKGDVSGGDTAEPEPGVALKAWSPDTPYLKALKAASAADRWRVYLAQRDAFGAAPSFFLDCADFFLEKKQRALALQVLSNVAELRLDDPPLLRVLAHRLAQLDELDAAARLFETVVRLRPEEPQSFRDLALVLARRAHAAAGTPAAKADFARAAELLATVVKRSWDRFQGIEIIALTELNRIWGEAEQAGVTGFPLDARRFKKELKTDVRIVMTWDADQTDMDLHVVEPSDEEADYSHNLTTIGGKVSRDFTQGYGPEVYALKKAMRGSYKVKTHFFGSSAAQLIGAVTLQVDVFTNYGRANEKRKSMTLRLTDAKEEFVVGEIEF